MVIAHTPLSLHARAQLFSHLAVMENAGVPVTQALASLRLPLSAQSGFKQLSCLVGQGLDLVTAGQRCGVLTPLEASLLYAAQSAGNLGRLYQRLGLQYARQAQQAKAMRSRLMLPGAVLLLALLVQPLPGLVAGSLSGAAYLWGVLQPLLILVGLFVAGRGLWRRSQQTVFTQLNNLWLALPMFGYAYTRRQSRDFFDSLGLLLEAGVPMFEALPKACATLSNTRLRADFQALSSRVISGQPLAKALQGMHFPGRPQLASLVASGEASGTLPAALIGYAQRESEAVASFEEQLATWLPRLAYVLVALWMAYSILGGSGSGPQLPADLR